MRPLKIALTFRNDEPMHRIWGMNGLSQNIKFLYDLYETMGHLPYLLINERSSDTEEYQGRSYRLMTRNELYNTPIQIDVAIEVGTSLEPDECYVLRERCNAKIACMRYGNAPFIDMEGLFTYRNMGTGVHSAQPDVVWISPHFQYARDYFTTLYDCPAEVSPFLWEPDFVDCDVTYAPRAEVPDVYVMEPNISVLKNALIPMTILEAVYREAPEAFGRAYILNAMHFNEQKGFLDNFVRRFKVLEGATNKTFFSPRAGLCDAFRRPDILLGFQHFNELNYLYNEALYIGAGLVHNSAAYAEVGYYYPGFEVQRGKEQLLRALKEHDAPASHDSNRAYLYRYSIHNPVVQDEHQRLLEALLA